MNAGGAMLRVLVVDDEPPARARLAQLLADCAVHLELAVVGEAGDGVAALDAVARLAPHVVLLDISMPGMNGIEVARHLAQAEMPPAVIFVTAFDEHALHAFEVQALDYLLKPVRAERLLAALQRVRPMAPHEARLDALAQTLGAARTQLRVSERGRLVLVPVDEIVFLRAELKYVTIRTPVREFLTEESLAALESEFDDHFVRIHRNALVARRFIAGFQRVKGKGKDRGVLQAPDGAEQGAAGEREAKEDAMGVAGEAGEGHWEVLLRGLVERLPISRRQWPVVKGAAGL